MPTSFLNLTETEKSRSIYRIISFARLCEFFDSGKLTLVRLEKWDDPFEKYLADATYTRGKSTIQLASRRTVYGSCWTQRAASDAMWRIYSPDKAAVRIKTTPVLMASALDTALARRASAQAFIGKVKYLPEREIVGVAREHAVALYKAHTRQAVAEAYLFKRNPFSHESEVRILLADGNARPLAGGLLQVAISPHALIQTILIDPRAPESMVQMYKGHLKSAYGFEKHVAKSTLYRPPKPLVVALDAR